MILITSLLLSLVLTTTMVESTVSCGGHFAPSCGDCGPQSYCNGDCSWSHQLQICKGRHGEELLPLTFAVAYDQTFSQQMRGDQEAVRAIQTIIRDANKKMGPESNLRPPVRLQVKGDILKVYKNVWLYDDTQSPRYLTSREPGVPLVIIVGNGGMAGKAVSGDVCNTWTRGYAYIVSSCDLSTRHNLAWCSNTLVHEIGHLIGMDHDVDIGCPDNSGHMSSQHTKWSYCSIRDWQLNHGRGCIQG